MLYTQVRKLIKIPVIFGKIGNLCVRGIHPPGVKRSREVVTQQKPSNEKSKSQTTETLMQWCGQVQSMIYQNGSRMCGVSEKVFNKIDNPENLKQKIDGQHSKPSLTRIDFDMKEI